jgi:hypothetical protein
VWTQVPLHWLVRGVLRRHHVCGCCRFCFFNRCSTVQHNMQRRFLDFCHDRVTSWDPVLDASIRD